MVEKVTTRKRIFQKTQIDGGKLIDCFQKVSKGQILLHISWEIYDKRLYTWLFKYYAGRKSK